MNRARLPRSRALVEVARILMQKRGQHIRKESVSNRPVCHLFSFANYLFPDPLLELRFESKLNLPWIVVRIGC